MRVLVLDSHTIYGTGLAACLEGVEGVDAVAQADSVSDAWAHPALPESDLVILDHAVGDGHEFIGDIVDATGARVLVCSSECSHRAVRSAFRAGAVGFLRKDTLTPETLANAVKAILNGGTGVVAFELLGCLIEDVPARATPDRRAREQARLTDREQRVLALIAGGHATREVAQAMCYSERTVKNVLHEATMKLNARSRSQAVAYAVREGLI